VSSKLKHLKVLKPEPKARWGMRGFKRDTIATYQRHFLDPRSYVSWPKNGQAHEILFGEDKRIRRMEVCDHFGGICTECGQYASPQAGFNQGSWDHKDNSAGNRCDCMHNALWKHLLSCHLIRHPQVRWTSREAVRLQDRKEN
jgi:hypothetical protein